MPDDRLSPPRWNILGAAPEPRQMWKNWQWPHCPVDPGLYAVYEDAQLVYIGSSRNIRTRLRAHLACGHWDRKEVWFKVAVMSAAWRERERRLVMRLKPRDNRQWVDAPGRGAYRPGFW